MRKYKRKHARNPDKRMAAAVRYRAQGLSLREIAKELACTHPTVLADLRRWDREHPNVKPLAVNSGGKSSPPRGVFLPPESTAADSGVISLTDRRKQA